METLAKSWAVRLESLCIICKNNGEKLDPDLKEGFQRQHADDWWKEFCEAAESGEVLTHYVWRSAYQEAARRRMIGWVDRLRVRNETARSYAN